MDSRRVNPVRGMGAVIRDHKGVIILLLSLYVWVVDSNFVEFEAIRRAFKEILSVRGFPIPKTIVESDYTDIGWDRWEGGAMESIYEVSEVRRFLSYSNSVSFSNIFCERNMLADGLVKKVACEQQDFVACL